jgi:hypoxanthine-guanine phosphoribosyltransferase
MDALLQEQEKLSSTSNLARTIQDVDKVIAQLTNARDTIASSMFFFVAFLRGSFCFLGDRKQYDDDDDDTADNF